MEKVRPWCEQPSDRGQLKNRTGAPVTKLWMVVQNAENGVVSGGQGALKDFLFNFIETMLLSYIVFEIQLAICRKSPILNYHTCNWRPRCG